MRNTVNIIEHKSWYTKDAEYMKYIGGHAILSMYASYTGFPGGSDYKESACDAGDLGLIPGLGRFPEEGKGYPVQHSGLENSKGEAKSQTQLSDFHFTSFHLNSFMLHLPQRF